jgi:hypothetical protein
MTRSGFESWVLFLTHYVFFRVSAASLSIKLRPQPTFLFALHVLCVSSPLVAVQVAAFPVELLARTPTFAFQVLLRPSPSMSVAARQTNSSTCPRRSSRVPRTCLRLLNGWPAQAECSLETRHDCVHCRCDRVKTTLQL